MRKLTKIALSVSVLTLGNSVISPLANVTFAEEVISEEKVAEDESKYEEIYNQAVKEFDGLGEKTAKEYLTEVKSYMTIQERTVLLNEKHRIILSNLHSHLEENMRQIINNIELPTDKDHEIFRKWSNKLDDVYNEQSNISYNYLIQHKDKLPKYHQDMLSESEYEKIFNEAFEKIDEIVIDTTEFYKNNTSNYTYYGYDNQIDLVKSELNTKFYELLQATHKQYNQETYIRYYDNLQKYIDEKLIILKNIETESHQKANAAFEEELKNKREEEQKKDEQIAQIPNLTNKVNNLTNELTNIKKQLSDLLSKITENTKENNKVEASTTTEIKDESIFKEKKVQSQVTNPENNKMAEIKDNKSVVKGQGKKEVVTPEVENNAKHSKVVTQATKSSVQKYTVKPVTKVVTKTLPKTSTVK